jgi:hypothetical protein
MTNNFLNCFSNLDVEGINQILKDEYTYEKMSKPRSAKSSYENLRTRAKRTDEVNVF